jgi:hypothetical protein
MIAESNIRPEILPDSGNRPMLFQICVLSGGNLNFFPDYACLSRRHIQPDVMANFIAPTAVGKEQFAIKTGKREYSASFRVGWTLVHAHCLTWTRAPRQKAVVRRRPQTALTEDGARLRRNAWHGPPSRSRDGTYYETCHWPASPLTRGQPARPSAATKRKKIPTDFTDDTDRPFYRLSFLSVSSVKSVVLFRQN